MKITTLQEFIDKKISDYNGPLENYSEFIIENLLIQSKLSQYFLIGFGSTDRNYFTEDYLYFTEDYLEQEYNKIND